MTVFTTWFGRSARIDDDTGTPVGINVAVGAVTITAAVFVAASVPIADPQWRCAVVAVALGLFAAFVVDWLAVAVVVLPTWMIMNGFLVNRLGDLSWHGWVDLDRFVVLVVAGCLGLAVGAAHRRVHGLRERWQLEAAVQEMRTEFNEETKHRA
jgi:MFS family permease